MISFAFTCDHVYLAARISKWPMLLVSFLGTEILGYDPGDYEVYLVREEPLGTLYDRPTN